MKRISANPHWRIITVALGLSLLFLALLWRLIDLSVINRTFLQQQYAERTIRDKILPAYRGMIVDRRGQPLAVSTPVYAVWADPKDLQFSSTQLTQLAQQLAMQPVLLQQQLLAHSKRQFIYLKRDLPPEIATQITALAITGIHVEKQYRRFYPMGAAAAQLVGTTNIDDQGQEGLELAYNQWLTGQAGIQKIVQDRYRNEVNDLGIIKPAIAGHPLVLSIDNRLQYMAYQALADGVTKFAAKSGTAVIIDVHTGEILAMVSVPSFNPNARPLSNNASHRNLALTDLFEPGSTIKAFAMTAALTTGKYQPHSLINTSPGYWYVNKKRIDDDNHDNGVIDLIRILQVSSNVGMSKVILSIPAYLFLNLLHQVGFTQPTGVAFPGESIGAINDHAATAPFVLATLSFGYSISVNLLQLAGAYAVLGNNGVKLPLSLLKVNQVPQGKSIIKPKVAEQIRMMLESVLTQGGTAVAAQVPGYRVTGKTGTTRILGPHGYEKHHHNAMFVGMAPANDPRLVIAVMLHDPEKNAYYGGFVAGPIFSAMMGQALRILAVPPEN